MYWTGQKQEMYFLACRMLNLSIERGMTPFTGSACTIVGMGYVDLFKRYSFGEVNISLGVYGSRNDV